MLRYSFFIFLSISFLYGYNKSEVKVLPKNFLDTKIGTVENQMLITFPKPKIKKIEKKLEKLKKVIINDKKLIKKRPKKVPLSVAKKKKIYIDALAPAIQEVYKKLQKRYEDVLTYIQHGTHENILKKLRKEYKVDSNIELAKAIKPHPVSIALAQGAIESAWLTSRFAKDANNIFGVWSFNKNEPRIAAGGSREGKVIYLKKYNSLEHSVEDYYKSIAKSWAYDVLRERRIYINNPYELLPLFEKYSEKGMEYTKILAKIIKKNKFELYDIKD